MKGTGKTRRVIKQGSQEDGVNKATASLEDGALGGRGATSFVREQKMERKEDSQFQWQEVMKALT